MRKHRVVEGMLRVLIFIALVLATSDKGSSQITSLEFLLSGVLFFIFLLSIIRFLNTSQSIPKPLIYLFGFLLLITVSVVIPLSNGVSFLWWTRRYFPILTLPMTILSSIVAFRSFKQITIAYTVLIFIGILVVISGLFNLTTINLFMINSLQVIRKYGGGYDAAFGICLTAPFLFYRSRRKKYLVRILIIFSFIVFLIGLIVSFTRTYWISTSLSLLFMVYILLKTRRITANVLLRHFVSILLILVFILWAVPSNVRNFIYIRIISIFHTENNLSFLDRMSELKGIWYSSLKNPFGIIIGNGLGSRFTFYSVDPFSWNALGWISNDYSHNYYAYLFWSTGITGLYLFLIFWFYLSKELVKAINFMVNTDSITFYFIVGIYTAIINLLVTLLTAPPLMSFKWSIYFGILIGLVFNIIRNINAYYFVLRGESNER